jgi:hypothetical protein
MRITSIWTIVWIIGVERKEAARRSKGWVGWPWHCGCWARQDHELMVGTWSGLCADLGSEFGRSLNSQPTPVLRLLGPCWWGWVPLQRYVSRCHFACQPIVWVELQVDTGYRTMTQEGRKTSKISFNFPSGLDPLFTVVFNRMITPEVIKAKMVWYRLAKVYLAARISDYFTLANSDSLCIIYPVLQKEYLHTEQSNIVRRSRELTHRVTCGKLFSRCSQ